ncbi:uncharacterized protein HMPREF1541_04904 [Cyphellophora europaea CBS 101466]|uniref:ferric-chelate reductase (NADPH) n=1 Tax=Cyphellophora europaea (strain CBS 101466) TaxID=1220924 RepID=W2RVZ5_CYPE1|nr:uncharacterized protein HMPREF1541_04904 [Cyphellophora europaea CBS 101466]ETN40627.1 hypothetical protein HMPREF1541_04904 [Cyphellophora europaea CBS 101466]
MLGYEYIFPPPEAVALRRQQLDATGFQAWLSPFALLLCSYLLRRPSSSSSSTSPPAPSTTANKPPTTLQMQTRRLTWLLHSPTHRELGPLLLPLLVFFYTLHLLHLATRHTSPDYLHLTKSLGHVAASQLPWQYLLALKSPNSPVTLATGLSHVRLNALHRVFGRVVHGLLAAHAVLYLRFFVEVGVLAKRVGDWDVRLGVLGFWAFNVLGALALPGMRRRMYFSGFYRAHVLLSAGVLVVLWAHVVHSRRYVAQAGVVWVVNGWLRWRAEREVVGVEVKEVVERGGELVRARLVLGEGRGLGGWVPGQHVYLRMGGSLGLLARKNPFTVVQADERSGRIMLVVRKLGGMTAALGDSKSSKELGEIKLEGPYGEAAEYLPPILRAGKGAGQVLLVAGGVGATYTVPIYLALLRARGDTSGVKMLWFVKLQSEVDWALELFKEAGKALDIDAYVTQASSTSTTQPSAATGIKGLSIQALGKRPDIQSVLEPIISPKSDAGNGGLVSGSAAKRNPEAVKKSYGKLTVMVCGPPSLSKSLRSEVGKHVMGYGREVAWYEEQFGFGGS